MPGVPPLTFTIRARSRAPFRAVAIEDLTNIVRIKWGRIVVSREELKAKRLAAQGVVGKAMQDSADMYDRITEAGKLVDKARSLAEAAHMADLQAQITDLKEMADELTEFGQMVPTPLAGSATAKPAPASKPNSSAALNALNASQPGPLDNKAWADGNAYHGTVPEGQQSG
jgi:hypothetical protein